MTEQRQKTATLNLRIDPALKAAVDKLAKADGRTITNLVEKLLRDAVGAAGLRPPPSKGKR